MSSLIFKLVELYRIIMKTKTISPPQSQLLTTASSSFIKRALIAITCVVTFTTVTQGGEIDISGDFKKVEQANGPGTNYKLVLKQA